MASSGPGTYILHMARRGSGIGFVMVLVTLVVVALLVARNWEKLAPVAAEITHGDAPGAVSAHGQPEAVEALRLGFTLA